MNLETEKLIEEVMTTPKSLVSDEPSDRITEAKLIALIVRQQELIVQQTEHLIRAMEVMDSARSAMPLHAQVDELLAALASVTPDDMVRVADLAKSMFDVFTGCGAVGGGDVRRQS